jgi:hypothetical protein
MNTGEYIELLRFLMEKVGLSPDDILFVPNIAEWCEAVALAESDAQRPMRLVPKESSGFLLLVKEYIPEEVVAERINALSIRSQLNNVAFDRAELLDSDKKKLSYFFLREYGGTLPEIQDDFLADSWAFEEMERSGFFNDKKGG